MRTMANNMAWMLKSLKREECPARERPQGTNFIKMLMIKDGVD